MKYQNYMLLKIAALSQNESFARSAVAAFCVQLDPTIEEIGDIKTAVSEAVTNAVVHGYGKNNEGEIAIFAGTNGNTLTITVTDKGRGIDDVEKAMQPFFTSGAPGERTGMGFTVMQAFCDKLKVSSAPGKGTRVTMRKKIGTKKIQAEDSRSINA